MKLEPLIINIKPKKTIEIIKTTIPLAFIAGLIVLNEKIPLYQIAANLGESSVGYFAPLAYIVQGLSLAISSISEVAIPMQAFEFNKNKKNYINNTIFLAGFGAVIGIVSLLFFGGFRSMVLPIIYSNEFLVYKDLFLIILGIGIIRFILAGFGTSITAAGYYKEQIPILIVSLFVTMFSGWFLIPRFGLNGAAYSVAVGLLTNLISMIALWFKIVRLK
jgi:O-antigen/teichoic acid export membrane protein